MTDKEMKIMMDKANKWDALAKKIEACYGKETEDGEWHEYNEDENDADLCTIGELAAIAFGWL